MSGDPCDPLEPEKPDLFEESFRALSQAHGRATLRPGALVLKMSPPRLLLVL